MSISQLFPEEGPTLNLNFAGSKTLDPRITFSRTSTATYMDDSGLIKVAPADSPRFDHRYVNGEIESLGLLVEESRSNLITYSNGLSSWGSAYSHTLNQDVVGPDGITNSAWTMDDTYTGGDGAFREKSFSVTPSTNQYCFSVFAKSGTAIWFDMYAFFIGSSTRAVYLNYVWGTNTLSVGSAENSPPAPTIYGKIEYPNGWNRFYFVFSDPTGLNNTCLFRLYPSSRNAGYVGSTLFYGAQIEAGAFPTSYMPTSASQFTRNRDTVSMTGDNFSDWYNQSEGSFYMNIRNIQQQPTGGAYTRLIDLRGTPTGDNYYLVAITPNGRAIYNEMLSNGSSQLNFGATYPIPNSPTGIVKITTGLQQNNFIAYNFASQFLSDTSSVTLPILNTLYIGRDQNGGSQINGHISQLTYYPTRLTNAQLQTLTK